MGEAKRKRDARLDAFATGKPFAVPPECPKCGSPNVVRILKEAIPPNIRKHLDCDIEICNACRAVWEAFPAGGYIEDPVCAEPCDNCAFRPGSPEQQDPETWRALMDSLKANDGAWQGGRFYCHKHVAIDMTKGPGNFLFPQKPVTMDGVPMRETDGTPVLTHDTSKMRTCSGFLRMHWSRAKKTESSKP